MAEVCSKLAVRKRFGRNVYAINAISAHVRIDMYRKSPFSMHVCCNVYRKCLQNMHVTPRGVS